MHSADFFHMHGLTCTICCPMSHPSLSIAWDQAWKPHGANNLNTSYDSFLESLDFASQTVRSAQKDTHSFVMRCCLNSESLPFMFKQCFFQLEKHLSVSKKNVTYSDSTDFSPSYKHQQTSTPGIFMLGLPRFYHVMLTPSLEVLGSYFVRPRMHQLQSPPARERCCFMVGIFQNHLCFI